MTEPLDQLREALDAEPLDSAEAAEQFRITYLGRKQGRITNLFKKIGEVPPEDRPAFGKEVNALKARAEERLEEAEARLQSNEAGPAPAVDLTLPGRRPLPGSVHPLTQTMDEITRIFERFGFAVATGPEIEDDWHNFTALNFPPDHPARDMQDTFFLQRAQEGTDENRDVVLRTHTSPVQIRVMEEAVRTRTGPPLRVVVPGRVYRNEAISYKSYCLFHQVEGLYVDSLPRDGGEGVTMADLKQTLTRFAQAFFGADVRMRFRPSYFPFTEPSAEVDVWWADEDAEGGGRWLEILGCGMVHPNVLTAVNIDPERYTGYAFGLGVERPAMLRYGIGDIRLFYENDVRFLEQF